MGWLCAAGHARGRVAGGLSSAADWRLAPMGLRLVHAALSHGAGGHAGLAHSSVAHSALVHRIGTGLASGALLDALSSEIRGRAGRIARKRHGLPILQDQAAAHIGAVFRTLGRVIAAKAVRTRGLGPGALGLAGLGLAGLGLAGLGLARLGLLGLARRFRLPRAGPDALLRRRALITHLPILEQRILGLAGRARQWLGAPMLHRGRGQSR